MTSRGIKFSSNDDEGEKSRLLDYDTHEDEFEVKYSGDSNLAVSKKRTRKLSDEEVYNLVDAGNAPKAPPLDQCVEAEVQPGDTLTKISLKYNIPVAELKRVNNILSEQQFYALKRIKIPVRAASLLTELLPAVHQAKGESKLENGWYVRDLPSPVLSGTGASSTVPSSPPSETEFENIQLSSSSNQRESLPVHEPGPSSKQTKKAKRFLKNVDKDLARIKERLDIDDEDDDSENGENSSSLMIRGESINEDENLSKLNQNGFVDSIRASKSRTACVLFVIIITVVLIVILIFAHHEFRVIEEIHHHKEKLDQLKSKQKQT